MDNNKNTANIIHQPDRVIPYRRIPYYLQQYITAQSMKRQISESEIIAECIQFHKENAGT